MKVASVAVILLLSLTACAQESAPVATTEQECVPQIRLDGSTYTGAGYTDIRGEQFSTAEQADCEDLGPSPRGSVFSERSDQIAVWSLPGYSTDQVLAARFDEDSFTVFVADSLPRGAIDRIVRELSSSSGAGQGASDCVLALRREATTYVERGFTEHSASKAGQADDSDCDDMGADAQGPYFPAKPRQIDVWSFDGQDPRMVLGVRQSNGTFRLFIAQNVDATKAAAILKTLGRSPTRTSQ